MYWIQEGYINKACFYFGRLCVICQWNTVVLRQKECLTQRWKLRKTSGEGLHRSQVLKNEKSFAKYGRAGRKGRKKGNLNRGNSTCKGTRLVTIGKGICSEWLEHRECRVHEKHEEWQEKSQLRTDNGVFSHLSEKSMLHSLGTRGLVTIHTILDMISH